MIAPTMIGDAALLARFAAIPGVLRTALAGEADRLGRLLRDQVVLRAAGQPVSLAVESTADGVVVTMATPSVAAARPQRATGPNAGRALVAPRSAPAHRFPRAAAARAVPPGLPAALAALSPEIRASLETAFRRVLVR
jgi:hypothetical protein